MNADLCRRLLPLLLAVLVAAGCGDDGTGPDDDRRGSLSFRFQESGRAAESFSAEGEVRFDSRGEPEFGTWAAAAEDRGENLLSIAGFRATGQGEGTFFTLLIPFPAQPGTISFDCDAEDPSAECESGGLLAIGVDLEDENDLPERFYFLTAGTVRITAISDERVRGTFEASGLAIDFLNPTADFVPVTVTAGEFDVPLVEQLSTGGGVVSRAGSAAGLRR